MTDHNNLAAQEQKADHDEGRLPVPMVCTVLLVQGQMESKTSRTPA